MLIFNSWPVTSALRRNAAGFTEANLALLHFRDAAARICLAWLKVKSRD